MQISIELSNEQSYYLKDFLENMTDEQKFILIKEILIEKIDKNFIMKCLPGKC